MLIARALSAKNVRCICAGTWLLLNHIKGHLQLLQPCPASWHTTNTSTTPHPHSNFLAGLIRILTHLGNFQDSSVGVSAASPQPLCKVSLCCYLPAEATSSLPCGCIYFPSFYSCSELGDSSGLQIIKRINRGRTRREWSGGTC